MRCLLGENVVLVCSVYYAHREPLERHFRSWTPLPHTQRVFNKQKIGQRARARAQGRLGTHFTVKVLRKLDFVTFRPLLSEVNSVKPIFSICNSDSL